MKRKITWMCILALLMNNICFFSPANVLAEEGENVGISAEEAGDEQPEGVESAAEPTDEGDRPEGVEPVVVPTDAAEPTDEGERPEGVEPVVVPTDAAEPTDEGDRPEGVEPVVVPTEAAKDQQEGSVSENAEEPSENAQPETSEVSGNGTISENETVSDDTAVSGNGTVSGDETEDEPENMIFSVQMPTSPEGRSSFDFILDPDGLIEKTGAKHYGGRDFQKGAHLFFMNDPVSSEEGGQVSANFSDTSDKKTIVNRSNVPVKVSISAKFTSTSSAELSENSIVRICEDPAFSGIDQPAVAFSLIDGDDNKASMNEDGEITCETILEEDGEFSFRITGAANPNADWSGVKQETALDVSWTVEPEKTEEKDGSEEEKEENEGSKTEAEDNTDEEGQEEISENAVSENETEDSVSENEEKETPSLSGIEIV